MVDAPRSRYDTAKTLSDSLTFDVMDGRLLCAEAISASVVRARMSNRALGPSTASYAEPALLLEHDSPVDTQVLTPTCLPASRDVTRMPMLAFVGMSLSTASCLPKLLS